MILKSLVHEPLEENITTRSGPIHKQTDTVHDVGRHLRTASRGKKKIIINLKELTVSATNILTMLSSGPKMLMNVE